MKLLRIRIENFGTLRDFRMDFSDSLNVLHRENGWGKSTLAVFIKAMLYGLPATTKRSLEENERKRYTPWQGGAFGGSLEFACDRGRFRIERFFGAKEAEDSFALYDLNTNLASRAFSQNVGEELFGIDADAFERTVYLSQRALAKGGNSSITARLGSLLEDVDDVDTYDGAMAALEERRKYYVKTGERGRIAELDRALAAARLRHAELSRAADVLAVREAELDQKKGELSGLQKELEGVQKAIGRAGYAAQRNVLLSELSTLDTKRREMARRLRGQFPSDEDLQEQRGLLEQLRDARAKRDAISAMPIRPERTRVLTAEAYAASPKSAMIAVLEQKNEELRGVCQREAVVKASMGGESRFAEGVPDRGELESARRALESVRQNTREEAVGNSKPARFAAWGLCIAGVACTALGILLLPLLVVGIVLLVASAAVFVISASHAKHALREREAKRMAEERRREEVLRSVRALLRRWGVQSDDPVRGLDELSFLVKAHSDRQSALREQQAELSSLAGKRSKLLQDVRAGLRAYGLAVSEKTDYRAEIDALKEDLSVLRRAALAEKERREGREAAEENCRAIEARMRPFAEKYDPERKVGYAELLRAVEGWERERSEAERAYAAKNTALRTLVRERGLEDEEGFVDEAVLQAREKALRESIKTCRTACETLSREVDSLSEQADTLSLVVAEACALEDALTEAKANSRTVELTKKYLEESKTALSTRYLSDMQESFAHFLSLLTEGEAPESVMDAELEVSLRAAGKTRDVAAFSRGWRDAVQFCVRLSLADALCGDGERPFLLLDDPFVNLDDARLAAARRLLSVLSERYQILYMVCHADRG